MANYYVAKSYQEWDKIGDVYESNGRMYLKVKNPKGTEKEVRAYSETEYRRLYKEAPPCGNGVQPPVKVKAPAGPVVKNVLGFQEGYIWIFKGDLENAEYWFSRTAVARYHTIFGWYVVSTDIVPEDIPSCIQSVKLPWNSVGNEDGTLKHKAEIESVLAAIRLDATNRSVFQGSVGDRIEVSVKVDRVVDLPANQYGSVSYLHTFIDENDNVYVWNTASKRLQENAILRIRGTVKEHKIYQGVKQTIFTRCSIL